MCVRVEAAETCFDHPAGASFVFNFETVSNLTVQVGPNENVTYRLSPSTGSNTSISIGLETASIVSGGVSGNCVTDNAAILSTYPGPIRVVFPYTVIMWAKGLFPGPDGTFFMSAQFQKMLSFDRNSNEFRVRDDMIAASSVNISGITDSAWHQFVLVCNSSSSSAIYFDTDLVATIALAIDQPIRYFAYGNIANNIDAIRIYNYSLSHEDIQLNYMAETCTYFVPTTHGTIPPTVSTSTTTSTTSTTVPTTTSTTSTTTSTTSTTLATTTTVTTVTQTDSETTDIPPSPGLTTTQRRLLTTNPVSTGVAFVVVTAVAYEPLGADYAVGYQAVVFERTGTTSNSTQSMFVDVKNTTAANAVEITLADGAREWCARGIAFRSGDNVSWAPLAHTGNNSVNLDISYPFNENLRLRVSVYCVNRVSILPSSSDDCIVDRVHSVTYMGIDIPSHHVPLLFIGAAFVAFLPGFVIAKIVVRCIARRQRRKIASSSVS